MKEQKGGVCLEDFSPQLSLPSLPFLPFPCPHSAIFNRRGLQEEAGRSQTGMGLKETYCEVTFFPNADRSQVSSWRNYPNESCPLWCLPRMRTWKGIRYGRVLSASHSELVSYWCLDSLSQPHSCRLFVNVEFLHCHVLLLKRVLQPSCCAVFHPRPSSCLCTSFPPIYPEIFVVGPGVQAILSCTS